MTLLMDIESDVDELEDHTALSAAVDLHLIVILKSWRQYETVKFNHDTVTLFDQFTPSDTEAFAGLDIISTLESISSANIDEPLWNVGCEFTH